MNAATPRFGWHAHIELEFAAQDGTSRLVGRKHRGPLLVQRSLYPEGLAVCQAILIHPPGGIAGGDVLDISARIGPSSHAQVTTPGAGKWYRSESAYAEQNVSIRVDAGARCEWLPQENIFFAGARAHVNLSIDLQADALFCGWELSCLGRPAAGECFDEGVLRQSTRLRIDGELCIVEQARISGMDDGVRSAPILAGHAVYGTMLMAGKQVTEEIVRSCREVDVIAPDRSGVTAMDRLLVARWVGASAQDGRAYFTALWRRVRPWLCGRDVMVPRIWAT